MRYGLVFFVLRLAHHFVDLFLSECRLLGILWFRLLLGSLLLGNWLSYWFDSAFHDRLRGRFGDHRLLN